METSYYDAIHAVLHAENDRCDLGPIESCHSAQKVAFYMQKPLGPIETSNSGANHAGLYAQNDRWGLCLVEIRYSDTKLAVLHAKATDECRNQ